MTASQIAPSPVMSAANGRRPVGRLREVDPMTRALELAVFAGVPLLATAVLAWRILGGPDAAIDFHLAYLVAGRRLLHGASPYLWSQARVDGGEVFVYPAPAAWLFVPFALLPTQFAIVLATLLCIAAGPATLALLGVRDRRLLAFVLLWPAVFAGWQTANVTLWLGLGLAACWRVRDRPWAAGLLTALLIALKPFTWPLVLWLLATRRLRAVGWSLLSGILVQTAAWLAIGPRSLHLYLALSGRVTHALFRDGYGIPALAAHLGLAHGVGTTLSVCLGLLCAAWCVWSARRGQDASALAATVALMLVASPLVWNHYFALLLVPLAIARPRFGVVWALPLVLWGCPSEHVALWQLLLTWGVSAGVLAACVRGSHGPRGSRVPAPLGPAFRLRTSP